MMNKILSLSGVIKFALGVCLIFAMPGLVPADETEDRAGFGAI